MYQISILTGSGFSSPAGVPNVYDLNIMFTKYKISPLEEKELGEILFCSFIQYYLLQIQTVDKFCYEDFFDFAMNLREEKNNFKKFLDSISDIAVLDYAEKRDVNNVVNDFIQKINDLLKDKLELNSNQMNKYPEYNNLINFLEHFILSECTINFHTLNHDVLLEFVVNNQSYIIKKEFCDGFDSEHSSYFGSNEITNKDEKIEVYKGNYIKKFNYIKLHGSIDNYIVYNLINGEYNIKEGQVVKINPHINSDDLYTKSCVPTSNENSYQYMKIEKFPIFLTGKKNKQRSYKSKIYKSKIEHFKHNLEKSGLLIVIGYGCGDNEINRIIINHYLKYGRKVVFIFKNNVPSLEDFKFYKDQIEISTKGVEHFDYKSLVNFV